MLGNAKRDMKVLVVEDLKIPRTTLARAIKEVTGNEPVQAENGQEAVAAFSAALAQDKIFDATLMDIKMPVMDGLQATTQIREMLAGRPATIYCITATREACPADKEALFTQFIDKNVNRRDLAKLLHEAADKAAKLQREAEQAAKANLVNAPSSTPLPASPSATGMVSSGELQDVLQGVADKAAKLESAAVSAVAVAATTIEASLQKGLQKIVQQAERLATVVEATTPAANAASAPVSFPTTPASLVIKSDQKSNHVPQQPNGNSGVSFWYPYSDPLSTRRLTPPSTKSHSRAFSFDSAPPIFVH